MFVSSLPPVVCRRAHVLFTLLEFVYIIYVVFLFFVFFGLVPPYVASFSGLFFLVLCTLCCQFLWIVFLGLVHLMLPVSLDCFWFFRSCVPYVASFSGLSFLIVPSVFSNVYLTQIPLFTN